MQARDVGVLPTTLGSCLWAPPQTYFSPSTQMHHVIFKRENPSNPREVDQRLSQPGGKGKQPASVLWLGVHRRRGSESWEPDTWLWEGPEPMLQAGPAGFPSAPCSLRAVWDLQETSELLPFFAALNSGLSYSQPFSG